MNRTETILNTLMVIIVMLVLVLIGPFLGHPISAGPDCTPGFDDETAAKIEAINAEV